MVVSISCSNRNGLECLKLVSHQDVVPPSGRCRDPKSDEAHSQVSLGKLKAQTRVC